MNQPKITIPSIAPPTHDATVGFGAIFAPVYRERKHIPGRCDVCRKKLYDCRCANRKDRQ